MNFHNFISFLDFDEVKAKSDVREPFIFEKGMKGKENTVTVRIEGRLIDKDLADQIWNGKDYLVSFNCEYKGKMGIGGWGGATEKPLCESLDVFKKWFDKWMRGFGDYEVEEYGQMALF